MHNNNTVGTTQYQTTDEALTRLEAGIATLQGRAGAKISVAAVLSILAKHTCPDQCMSHLTSSTYSRVDSFYSERHRFIQSLTIDRLRLRLRDEGIPAILVAENQLRSGKGDIDIIANHSCIDLRVQDRTIRIELKGGGNFDISQVLRYLSDIHAVVVCLAGRGEAFVIKREEALQLVESVASTSARKLETLLNDSSTRIPGPWCSGCPLQCEHHKPKFEHKVNLQTEFVKPLASWIPAIDSAIDKVVLLLRELAASGTSARAGV